MKHNIEGLEAALQDYELQIEQLEAREEHWKEELHHFQDQVRDRDYLMGEAIVQIREVADHLQDLAAQANEVKDQMLEAQRNMMAEMAQLLRGTTDKGKAPMTTTEEDNEGHPPGFTPPHVQTQPKAYPRGSSVTIRPQQGQVDAGIPMNFQTGSGFNPGDNPANPVIPDLDIAEREEIRLESSRQLEERCRWLEEKFKALENADNRQGIDAKDLSLVPNLVLPHKFKIPKFDKYNGTTCSEAHITMFCRRMTSYVNNDQLLIHCFQDSLVGAAARW
ncbi:intracellular protein transport protein USO1-like [Gossypium arboreum]|uniref:intracellular protein transport protein USO1-like n=1 Tax=Gossypium arboreum TaxID=29729 RepID=UPI0022F18889|nr:intracellular protein transport protein USO1-like [Gossypium arboreum]